MAVLVSGKDADEAYMYAMKLVTICKMKNNGASVIGPGKAGIGKINDSHRFVFYIKSADADVLTGLKDIIEQTMDSDDEGVVNRVRVTLDLNPMNPF